MHGYDQEAISTIFILKISTFPARGGLRSTVTSLSFTSLMVAGQNV